MGRGSSRRGGGSCGAPARIEFIDHPGSLHACYQSCYTSVDDSARLRTLGTTSPERVPRSSKPVGERPECGAVSSTLTRSRQSCYRRCYHSSNAGGTGTLTNRASV
jgi:hypothetical protein